jgi:hypothetical protein
MMLGVSTSEETSSEETGSRTRQQLSAWDDLCLVVCCHDSAATWRTLIGRRGLFQGPAKDAREVDARHRVPRGPLGRDGACGDEEVGIERRQFAIAQSVRSPGRAFRGIGSVRCGVPARTEGRRINGLRARARCAPGYTVRDRRSSPSCGPGCSCMRSSGRRGGIVRRDGRVRLVGRSRSSRG